MENIHAEVMWKLLLQFKPTPPFHQLLRKGGVGLNYIGKYLKMSSGKNLSDERSFPDNYCIVLYKYSFKYIQRFRSTKLSEVLDCSYHL